MQMLRMARPRRQKFFPTGRTWALGRLHSEAKRLKGLESRTPAEKLLADAMLDNAALKDLRCYAEDATLTLMGTTPEI